MDLTNRGRFAYEQNSTWPLNTVYMLTGHDIKHLCPYLNSTLVTWFVQSTALTSGMGVTRWFSGTVSSILTPTFPKALKVDFIRLLEIILEAKDRNPDADTSELERQIDRLVYDLYGLTEEEIAAVEARVGAHDRRR